MDVAPAVSVILATRNRADSLAMTLGGLAKQVDAPPFEVIVADNGSRDRTQDVIREFASALPLRSVVVRAAGKGRALNAALREARGELVVFTDDDVEADPQWLGTLHAASVANPAFVIFGGRIEIDGEELPGWIRRSRKLSELLAALHERTDPVYEHNRYPFGPNMAVRRRLIAHIEAPYPEHLGPGTATPVGDETAFLTQLSPPDASDRLYVADARVLHRPGSHHFTFVRAARRSWIQGVNEGQFGISGPSKGPPRSGSLVRRAFARVFACRSVREFLCVLVQHAGYMLSKIGRSRAVRQGVSMLLISAVTMSRAP